MDIYHGQVRVIQIGAVCTYCGFGEWLDTWQNFD